LEAAGHYGLKGNNKWSTKDIYQLAGPAGTSYRCLMDWVPRLLLIAVMVISYVVLWRLMRTLVRKLGQWLAPRRYWTDLLFSVVLILWGAIIWYLLISKDDHTNLLAVMVASISMWTGTYCFVRQLAKKR
jgi:hypothetical protein